MQKLFDNSLHCWLLKWITNYWQWIYKTILTSTNEHAASNATPESCYSQTNPKYHPLKMADKFMHKFSHRMKKLLHRPRVMFRRRGLRRVAVCCGSSHDVVEHVSVCSVEMERQYSTDSDQILHARWAQRFLLHFWYHWFFLMSSYVPPPPPHLGARGDI